MKLTTWVRTSHTLDLDETERFDVTTKVARPITIRVSSVIVSQDRQGGQWDIRALGNRILKSGALGKVEKLDTWTYRNRFNRDVQVALLAEMSPAVRGALHELGVTIDG